MEQEPQTPTSVAQLAARLESRDRLTLAVMAACPRMAPLGFIRPPLADPGLVGSDGRATALGREVGRYLLDHQEMYRRYYDARQASMSAAP